MTDSISNSRSSPQLNLFAKLTCNSVTRRIQVPSYTSIELSDFEQQIRLLFQLEPDRAIRFTYLDEDGDIITVGSTIELIELFKSAATQEAGSGAEYGTVKLNVQVTGNSGKPMSEREGHSNDKKSSNKEENQEQDEGWKGKEKENEETANTASSGNPKGDDKNGAEKLEQEITTFVESLKNVVDTNPELVQQGQKIIEEASILIEISSYAKNRQ
ncbi:hypothetical protein BKA69DRAFT_504084 [Paraphysoderma sedebokerense]|nr:hypothetical protein BKA69DRAFT_941017 [Paraphysoderma sedebokerense]KAI9140666.1 hypothetical protein BKA69DRAFT_504084 [Paraphysoderma sedebokerense]